MKGLFAFEAEPFEFEAYGGSESVIVRSAIRSGTTDENRLADLIFFRRHPERNGRPISRSEPNSQQLGREWLDIRDRLVRPALASTAPFPAPAPGPVPSPTGLLPVVGMENTSAAFREKVIRIARDLGTDPNYLMAIMSFESAGFDPAARNKLSGATGLIQFMPSTATRLGTTTDALARMSAEDQLDYVAAYFAEFRGRLKTLEDAYMAVLYRPAVGMGPEHVLFRSGDPSTGTAYAQNSPLDLNKDGRITVAEATSFVRKRFITGSRELEADFFEFAELPLSEETELGFGEAGEEEFSFGSSSSYVPSSMESVVVRSAIRSGTTNENSLTDLIFFRRHPERNGRALSGSESGLIQEWLSIRDTVVRPVLRGTAPFPAPAPGPVPSPTGLLPVVGMENTSAAFREKVIRIARDLGTDPNYLMAIMSFESAGFDPAARNKLSGATGLIQFMPSTATRLGTTTDALARMSAEDQLDYVAAYFAEFRGRLKTLEDAYMAVLYRPAVGMGPEHVLFRSGDPSTGTAYAQNSPLDLNKDGRITVAEATSFVRKRFITGSRELEADFFEFAELPLSEETELGFGEAGEEEFSFGSSSSYVPSSMESVVVRSAIRSGTTNENSLTDLIFFRRHPERNGRALSGSESGLIQEWLSIRDTVVRPVLRGTAPARPSPVPGTGGGTGAPDIVTVRSVFKVARQIAPKLEALLAAAEADGIRLGHNSSFRTREKQIALRKKYCGPTDFDIFEKPSSQCTPQVARPGTSNHEKGLAIDFSYNGIKMGPDNPGFRWLAANAGRFDFYNLPGEPWHWSVDGK